MVLVAFLLAAANSPAQSPDTLAAVRQAVEKEFHVRGLDAFALRLGDMLLRQETPSPAADGN